MVSLGALGVTVTELTCRRCAASAAAPAAAPAACRQHAHSGQTGTSRKPPQESHASLTVRLAGSFARMLCYAQSSCSGIPYPYHLTCAHSSRRAGIHPRPCAEIRVRFTPAPTRVPPRASSASGPAALQRPPRQQQARRLHRPRSRKFAQRGVANFLPRLRRPRHQRAGKIRRQSLSLHSAASSVKSRPGM